MMTTDDRVRKSPRRRGVSILEFFGCMSALAGGVVLGSLYLGADVKEMAYVVLEKAHFVEPRIKSSQHPASTQATTPAGANSASPPPTTTTQSGHPQTPLAAAEAEPAAETPTAESSPTPPPTDPPPAPSESTDAETALPVHGAGLFAREDLITPEQRQALTLAYWDALGVCMKDEEQHRVPAIDAEGNWQLFDYLTGRKDGHVKAAAEIAALDARGVDDHVMAYAKKAHAWHEDGARLFARAVDLLTDAPTAQLSGPFAQSWQSASTQHRMEARLLAEKQQAVRSYLDHAYGAAPAPPTTDAPAAQ